MKFYTQDIVKQARELRKKGTRTSKICKETGVTKDTILRWCFDIPSNNTYHLNHLEIKQKLRDIGKNNVEKVIINKDTAKIFASLIYWCEGAKYTNCNSVGFSNSDVNLIRTFLELFRIGFNPREEKIKAHLQLHTTHDKKEMISFWSKTLKIPENQFQKSTITKPMAKMKRTDYKGTCTVKYYDFKLFNEIIGTYQGFFEKYILLRRSAANGKPAGC